MGNLGAKACKALKEVARGELAKEIAFLEEQALRKTGQLLDGRIIYAMFIREFAKDSKLARPMVLKELQRVKQADGKGALRGFMATWETHHKSRATTGVPS